MIWKHDELQADLAEFLRHTRALVTWENMQLGPHGSCRPDVYTIPKSYTKFRPLAYEVKVTIPDLKRDMTTGKWTRYLDYACGVVFAVPAGLATKADLPKGCGLMVRGDDGWRTVKAPTLQAVDTLPRDTWIKLVLDGIERANGTSVAPREGVRSWKVENQLRHRHGEHIAKLVAQAHQSELAVENAIELREKQAREIKDGTQRRLKSAIEHVKASEEYLEDELQRLAKVLGLSEKATPTELAHAVTSAAKRLSDDRELQALRRNFKRIADIANEGTQPLPGEEASWGAC